MYLTPQISVATVRQPDSVGFMAEEKSQCTGPPVSFLLPGQAWAPENKGIPGLDHEGEAILGVTQGV